MFYRFQEKTIYHELICQKIKVQEIKINGLRQQLKTEIKFTKQLEEV